MQCIELPFAPPVVALGQRYQRPEVVGSKACVQAPVPLDALLFKTKGPDPA